MVKVIVRTDDGVTIEMEVDTEEYPKALETTLRAIKRASSWATPPPVFEPTPPHGLLTEFIDRLSDETVDYLALLVNHPKGLSDDEIAEKLGIDNRQKLAGMNGAITKVAANVGIPESMDIIQRQVTRDADGSRTYHYTVPHRVRAALDELLPDNLLNSGSPGASAPPPSDDDVPF